MVLFLIIIESEIRKLKSSNNDRMHTIEILNHEITSLKSQITPETVIELKDLKREKAELEANVSELKMILRENASTTQKITNRSINEAVSRVENELNEKWSIQLRHILEKHQLEVDSYNLRLENLKKQLMQYHNEFNNSTFIPNITYNNDQLNRQNYSGQPQIYENSNTNFAQTPYLFQQTNSQYPINNTNLSQSQRVYSNIVEAPENLSQSQRLYRTNENIPQSYGNQPTTPPIPLGLKELPSTIRKENINSNNLTTLSQSNDIPQTFMNDTSIGAKLFNPILDNTLNELTERLNKLIEVKMPDVEQDETLNKSILELDRNIKNLSAKQKQKRTDFEALYKDSIEKSIRWRDDIKQYST